MRRLVVFLGVACVLVTAARADVRLPSLISSGMVLQQQRPAPIWGFADPGERVTVKIDQQSRSTVTDGQGNWRVTLSPLEVGAPRQITVTGKNTIILNDVLVGEVWLCGGQSNMEWPVNKAFGANSAAAMEPINNLRLFKVEKHLADAPQEDVAGNWRAATAAHVAEFSAVGFYFGRRVQEQLGVPIGLIHCNWGGTPVEAWMSLQALQADPDFISIIERERQLAASASDDEAKWNQAVAKWEEDRRIGVTQAKKPARPRSLQPYKNSNVLYNGMIAPLAPYALAGVIWYQGEANAERAVQYRHLLPALIADWRRAFEHERLPFGVVQLANFGEEQRAPGERSSWAELREAQLLTVNNTPYTGLVVTIDIGQADDIHPRNKLDVGYRLARWALHGLYGRTRIVHSGPVLREMKIDGSRVRLSFDHAGGLRAGREGGEQLKGFELAGKNRKFHFAEAAIQGEEVVLSSPQVTEPVAVRYGWAKNPVTNLRNTHLPASPFRTDDWPLITEDRK